MDRRGVMAGLAATLTIPAGAARAGKLPAHKLLQVMSFNVRLPLESDGPNRWEARRELFIETIARAVPDLMGTQELWKIQGDFIAERLPQLAWFGRDRRGGHDDEHMGVFYRRDRFRLIEQGDFWLSDTPDVPGSISWGHPYPRMATWGYFEQIADRRRIWFINTHFPYRAEDEEARSKCAAQIAAWIAARPAREPVVLTGDFNTGPDSAAHRILTATLVDARMTAPLEAGPQGTFHGFSGTPGKRIDWILSRGLEPRLVATDIFGRDGRYPSDHFPVTAGYGWP